MSKKVCSNCEREKPLSEFNKKSESKDGLQYYCKFCQSHPNEGLEIKAGLVPVDMLLNRIERLEREVRDLKKKRPAN